VLYDQRGSLRSPAADGLISLEAFVADLEALRRELGVARMTLFAHSMGAAIAYAYLQRHPDHVRGIVLSGPVLPDEFRPDTARRGRSERAFVAFAQRNDSAEAARQGLDRPGLTGRDWTRRWRISFASGNIFHVDRWPDVQGGQAFYNGRIARLVYQQSPRELLDGGLTSLRRNAVPIDIVLGDHDLTDFGAVYWPEIAPTLPNARVTVLREAGHNAWVDQPVEYTAALRRAFARIRATPVRASAGSSNVAAPAPTSRAH
jgi:pimeloyl-ACP methyl ester carboxylesterase